MKVYIVLDSDGRIRGTYFDRNKAEKGAMRIYAREGFQYPIVVCRTVRK